MAKVFTRTPQTWLAYSMMAFYSYYINIIGPITPFFKDEMRLSYTVSSLHYTAFAAGILVIGLFGAWVIQRTGRKRALWIGAIGMSLTALALAAGREPFFTILASFLMGTVGSLILAIVPSMLSDQYGEQRAVAISEVNMLSSITGAVGPLLLGWFALTSGGWCMALIWMALAPFGIWLGTRHAILEDPISAKQSVETGGKKRLPRLYWAYWLGIVLVVSVEFCMISWSGDYLEHGLGMIKASAAQAISIFMVSMILGRWATSRLVQQFSSRLLVSTAILLALIGFILFWLTPSPIVAMVGLFITGLGVAGLYPLTLSMAISAGGEATVQAGARATLASGTAVLALPLLLGRLADFVGIHMAYSLVIVLLLAAFLLIQVSEQITEKNQSQTLKFNHKPS